MSSRIDSDDESDYSAATIHNNNGGHTAKESTSRRDRDYHHQSSHHNSLDSHHNLLGSDDNDSSNSRFLSRLDKEINRIPNRTWRSSFVEYIRLRRLIEKIVIAEDEMNEELNNSSFNNSVNPNNTDIQLKMKLNSKLTKSHDLFWAVLKAEIDKVNTFFLEQQEKAECEFKQINVNVPKEDANGNIQHASPLVSLTFAKVLMSKFPDIAGKIFDEQLMQAANQLNAVNPQLATEYGKFFDLCQLLDQLRKFIVLNYIILLKILKVYDRYTHRDSQHLFVPSITEEPFYTSASLALLLQKCDAIVDYFVARKPVSSNELSCKVCHLHLNKPVLLSCSCRICFDCLTKSASFGENCPVCNETMKLDPVQLQVESVLTRFVGITLEDNHSMNNGMNKPLVKKSASLNNLSQNNLMQISNPEFVIPTAIPSALLHQPKTQQALLNKQKQVEKKYPTVRIKQEFPSDYDNSNPNNNHNNNNNNNNNNAIPLSSSFPSLSEHFQSPIGGNNFSLNSVFVPPADFRTQSISNSSNTGSSINSPRTDSPHNASHHFDSDSESFHNNTNYNTNISNNYNYPIQTAPTSHNTTSSHSNSKGSRSNSGTNTNTNNTTNNNNNIAMNISNNTNTHPDPALANFPPRASCHRCKSTKDSSLLMFCSSKGEGKKKHDCHKKYCLSCLKRLIGPANNPNYNWWQPENRLNWKCPSCFSCCSCANCQRTYAWQAVTTEAAELAKQEQSASPIHRDESPTSLSRRLLATAAVHQGLVPTTNPSNAANPHLHLVNNNSINNGNSNNTNHNISHISSQSTHRPVSHSQSDNFMMHSKPIDVHPLKNEKHTIKNNNNNNHNNGNSSNSNHRDRSQPVNNHNNSAINSSTAIPPISLHTGTGVPAMSVVTATQTLHFLQSLQSLQPLQTLSTSQSVEGLNALKYSLQSSLHNYLQSHNNNPVATSTNSVNMDTSGLPSTTSNNSNNTNNNNSNNDNNNNNNNKRRSTTGRQSPPVDFSTLYDPNNMLNNGNNTNNNNNNNQINSSDQQGGNNVGSNWSPTPLNNAALLANIESTLQQNNFQQQPDYSPQTPTSLFFKQPITPANTNTHSFIQSNNEIETNSNNNNNNNNNSNNNNNTNMSGVNQNSSGNAFDFDFVPDSNSNSNTINGNYNANTPSNFNLPVGFFSPALTSNDYSSQLFQESNLLASQTENNDFEMQNNNNSNNNNNNNI